MERNNKQRKILISGSAQGSVAQLLKRVDTLNNSANGPFDLLFIINLFSQEEKLSLKDHIEKNSDIRSCIDGTRKVPIPTFFLDSSVVEDSTSEICQNLTYLGSSGITTIQGLQVAFFSENGSVASVLMSLVKEATSEPSNLIDILLTDKWPKGILNNIPGTVTITEQQASINESDEVAMLSKNVKPRYHFANSKENLFYERLPYKNSSSTNAMDITRFIALASAFNTTKQKYLHALSLSPLSEQGSSTTSQNNNTNIVATESPFNIHSFESSSSPSSQKQQSSTANKRQRDNNNNNRQQEFAEIENQEGNKGYSRWESHNNNNSHQQDHHSRGKRQRSQGFQNKPPNLQSCRLCLSNADAETHLVVSVATEVYVVLAKGGLHSDHCMIVPVQHTALLADGSISKTTATEIENYKQSILKYLATKQQTAIFFHLNIPSRPFYHTNIQVFPISEEVASEAEVLLHQMAGEQNMIFSEMNDSTVDHAENYMLFELPNKKTLAYHIPRQQKINFQFSREVIVALMNLPKEKIDWQQCVLAKEEEGKQAEQFKQSFKSFDFSLSM